MQLKKIASSLITALRDRIENFVFLTFFHGIIEPLPILLLILMYKNNKTPRLILVKETVEKKKKKKKKTKEGRKKGRSVPWSISDLMWS